MAIATVVELDYPTSDGKPMAETDIHRDQMVEAIEVLKGRYADDPDIYVSGNLLVGTTSRASRANIALPTSS